MLDKAVENRARRHASAAGLRLERSSSRTPGMPGHGLYRLRREGYPADDFTLTLEEVERELRRSKDHPSGWTSPRYRTDRWLTPRWLVEPLGRFDLDPCGAPKHVLAERTYLPEQGDDGLSMPWIGRTFCNPPYSAASTWMRRMAEHGHGTLLTFARVDTKAFHDHVWERASAVLFLRGRVKFLRPDGSASNVAGAPSVLASYGEEDLLALRDSGLVGKFIRL